MGRKRQGQGNWDDIIAHAETLPFSDSDIKKMTENKCRIVPYHVIAGLRTPKELFGRHNAVVILYEISPGVGHWVAVLRYGPKLFEFFDPIGGVADSQLKHVPPSFRKKSNQNYPYLSELLQQNGGQIVSNHTKLQENLSQVNTCGRFCALRVSLFHFGYGLEDFIALWKNNKMKPDQLATIISLWVL